MTNATKFAMCGAAFGLVLFITTKCAHAQPFCRGAGCGPVDPRMNTFRPDAGGYRRGPVGDWVDRCFYCQGPMPRYPEGHWMRDRNDRPYLPPPFPPYPVNPRY